MPINCVKLSSTKCAILYEPHEGCIQDAIRDRRIHPNDKPTVGYQRQLLISTRGMAVQNPSSSLLRLAL